MQEFNIKQIVYTMYSALIVFLVLLVAVALKMPIMMNFDQNFIHLLIEHNGIPSITSFNDQFVNFFAVVGGVFGMFVLTAAIAAWLIYKRQYVDAIYSVALLAGGSIINTVIKSVVHRPRPEFHLARDTGFSFPSGHSIGVTLFFAAVVFFVLPHIQAIINRRIIFVILSLFAIFVLWSRLYFSAHYPSDVLGGVALGTFIAMLTIYLRIRFSGQAQLVGNDG